MDPIWAGVIGTIAGGIVGSATSLLSPLILWRTEEKRLKLEHDNAKALNEIEQGNELERIEKAAVAADKAHKRELVESWRTGLAESARLFAEHEHWEDQRTRRQQEQIVNGGTATETETRIRPFLNGVAWYASLRPHLRPTEDDDLGKYTRPGYLEAAPQEVFVLYSQIALIEKDWGLV